MLKLNVRCSQESRKNGRIVKGAPCCNIPGHFNYLEELIPQRFWLSYLNPRTWNQMRNSQHLYHTSASQMQGSPEESITHPAGLLLRSQGPGLGVQERSQTLQSITHSSAVQMLNLTLWTEAPGLSPLPVHALGAGDPPTLHQESLWGPWGNTASPGFCKADQKHFSSASQMLGAHDESIFVTMIYQPICVTNKHF